MENIGIETAIVINEDLGNETGQMIGIAIETVNGTEGKEIEAKIGKEVATETGIGREIVTERETAKENETEIVSATVEIEIETVIEIVTVTEREIETAIGIEITVVADVVEVLLEVEVAREIDVLEIENVKGMIVIVEIMLKYGNTKRK